MLADEIFLNPNQGSFRCGNLQVFQKYGRHAFIDQDAAMLGIVFEILE